MGVMKSIAMDGAMRRSFRAGGLGAALAGSAAAGSAVSIRVENGEQLAKQLARIGNAGAFAAMRAVRRACYQEIKPLREAAREGAPVVSGRLKRSIKVRPWRGVRGEVGYKLYISRGDSRDDKTGAWYGKFIEQGFAWRGKFHPGRHMLRNAYTGKAAYAAEAVARAMQEAVSLVIAEGL